MSLAAHTFTQSSPSGTGRLVLLHGFTQTATSWTPVADAFAGSTTVGADEWDLTALDLPGHGGSPDGARSLQECASDVADSLGTPPPVLVGYSMGARIALHVALDHPDAIAGLVLVSGTAGIEDPVERTERIRADEALASHLESIGTKAFVEEWLAQPMFATLSREAARVRERTTNAPTGLAASLRRAGTGTQDPLWSRLGEIRVPTLVVTGDLDAKFTLLGDRLAGSIPHSARIRIPGAGHTVHLEKTPGFVDAVTSWLAGPFRAGRTH